MDKEVNVTMKFDGEYHEVEVETYANVLLNYSQLITEISKELDSPVAPSLKVKSNSDGSLDVALAIGAIASLLQGVGVGNITEIFTASVDILKFFEFSAENKLKEVVNKNGVVLLVGNNNNVTQISNQAHQMVLNNPDISKTSRKMFENLDTNDDVSGFGMYEGTSGEEVFYAPRSKFEKIIDSTNYAIENRNVEDVRKEIVSASLTVVKPLLLPSDSRKWSFMYGGFAISAPIKDEDYIKKIPFEKFGMNDVLEVDLEITQRRSNSMEPFRNDSFAVVKVHKHITTPTPEMLF